MRELYRCMHFTKLEFREECGVNSSIIMSFSAEAVSQFFCCCDAHPNSGVPNLEEGLPRWLSGKRIHLPMQEIWV